MKITFIGAGSTIFAKNILGDTLLTPALSNATIALYDIDKKRLHTSRLIIEALNNSINSGSAKVEAFLGVENRKKAIAGANFIINAIQVGGYKPSTVVDFEIPKKYGLRQTIGDTLGIGGIFRGLRTLPVMLDIAHDIEENAPDAWLLNYTNPMAIIMGGLFKGSQVKGVGLCHSVQGCATHLLKSLKMDDQVEDLRWKIAGINHMAWLLEIFDGKRDLYPEIKRRAFELNQESQREGAKKHDDMVRYEIMRHFGYYTTESSEHNAEYTPYWIKEAYPDLIDTFNIPLDEYPRRCEEQIANWEEQERQLLGNKDIEHKKTAEYGAAIMEAIATGTPTRIHGNIKNNHFIENLPQEAVVEVPCLIDKNGVQGVSVGALPPQCAALNTSNINVQTLTIEAALNRKKESIYQAAMMDPHTAGELSLDKIVSLCDDLIEAHKGWLPEYT